MNIFDKITAAEWKSASRLGSPARNEYEFLLRNEAMARLNPNGFRTPPKEPRIDASGKTRGDRKRQRRDRINWHPIVPPQHLHSAARRRAKGGAA
ncbi:hypothetical protein [Hoeflea alexandrii]|uniref:Uncharacterized protein n=1 Tax=Hoeflea alexandrii TaxID=288436 RepID=A0ABT1CP20_9HYPH|nr:hypothetical protein [Hoeflea alexandrii]MCO6407330.1 hypothetical protein [Hoeflea alexandrii]MCY0154273.1 hypothetical protein [Hoeflea alexandrii]